MAIRDRFVSEAGVIAGADSLALRTSHDGTTLSSAPCRLAGGVRSGSSLGSAGPVTTVGVIAALPSAAAGPRPLGVPGRGGPESPAGGRAPGRPAPHVRSGCALRS